MTFQEEEVAEVFYVPFAKLKEMVENNDPELVRHEAEFEILFEYLDKQ